MVVVVNKVLSYLFELHKHYTHSARYQDMSFTEKIDTLDMIIAVLQEHEKNLDGLIHRLEKVTLRVLKDPDDADLMRRLYEPL